MPSTCSTGLATSYGRAVTIAYDQTLRERIGTNLAGHDRRIVTDSTKRHAAVAVVVVDSEVGEDRVDPAPVDDWIAGRPMEAGLDGRMVNVSGGTAFLLCRRASRLTSHAAQWALPGGRLDPGETPIDAALRELDEEVGIRLPDSAVLGMLDDYPTRSGYVITPVVIWGGGKLDPRPAPDEVVAVYRVGLYQLQRDDSPRFITIPESPHPVVQIPLGNDLIHAPTGAVLLHWVAMLGGSPRPGRRARTTGIRLEVARRRKSTALRRSLEQTPAASTRLMLFLKQRGRDRPPGLVAVREGCQWSSVPTRRSDAILPPLTGRPPRWDPWRNGRKVLSRR